MTSTSVPTRPVARWSDALRDWLPRGGSLPDRAWRLRHRGITWLAAWHVPVLAAAATYERAGAGAWLAIGLVAALALAATRSAAPRAVLASFATCSLLVSTATLIHLFHGLIELHFHFFVVIAVVAMYQLWTPYLLAIGFVLAHHAVMGVALPMAVFNHAAAIEHPVLFAMIHGGFVLAESLACLTFWKVNEQALDREREQRARAEESSRALEVANQEVSDLVAMVSHDLRAPLTVVNGNVELALEVWDDLDDPARQDLVRRVGAAGQSLEEMLSGILTLTALDADGIQARPTPFRLDQHVQQVLTSLGDPLVMLDLSGLAPVTVVADRQHVHQVVANLATNAAKYGAPPFAVSTALVGDHVHLVVADSGPGVPEEFVPRLFERYSRSESARRGRQRGTGLGLFIVSALVSASDGTISYAPRPGGGGSFTVVLPAGVAAVEEGPLDLLGQLPTRGSSAPA